jgi:UDP-N-acetylglucosamine--N-acetylmuramyl-(pentapeptide) pyrophosphoryl-undecaprenol N-acetylglucosamine transferase
MQKKIKVVLTGGHGGTTAIATVFASKKQNKDWEIHWIGTKKAVEGKSALTLEFKALPEYGVICHSLIAGRFQKRFTRHTFPSLAKFPIGFLQSLVIVLKIRPSLTVSYGGFAAFPVVFWSFIFGIPVIIHEQTMAIGLANKFSIPFAKKIAVSRKESSQFFPSKKTILTGNPVSPKIALISPKEKIGNPPTIFIIGGSRGSQIINRALFPILEKLLLEFKLIHISGN